MKEQNVLAQLSQIFSKLERELSYEETNHYNINIIFFLKVYVINSYFIELNSEASSPKSKDSTLRILFNALYSLYKILTTPSQVLFASRSTCWSKVGKNSIHRFFDSTLRHVKQRNYLVLSFDKLENSPVYSHVYETNHLTKLLSSGARKWLRFFRPDILNELEIKMDSLISHLKEIHTFDEKQTKKRIKNNFSSLYFLLPLYAFVLKFKGVKTIYMTCFYSIENLAMVMASKKLGIETIDIQHGVINKVHPAYNSFHASWNFLPDKLWLWSIKEKELLEGLNWPYDKLIVKGSQYNNIDFSDLINEQQRTFIQSLKNDHRIKILVCLQTFMFEYRHFMERFGSVVNQTADSVIWMVRLHPSMIKQINDFKGVKVPINLNIVESSELFLPLIIQCSDFLLTMNSSVALDFASVGKKIIFFRQEDKDFYADLISPEQSMLLQDNECFKKVLGI